MSGETIVVYGTTKTLESSGASISNSAIAQADDASYDISVDGNNYPNADFVLTGTFGTAPTENAILALYARPLDVDGTSDTEIPETTRPTRLVGIFIVNNVTTSQTMYIEDVQVPPKADYYLHNNGTGQSLSAGWVLKVKPRTLKIAP